MPFNGVGSFTPSAADFPAVTLTVIDSTKYNNVVSDVATGLSTCITKDGQTVITANIPGAGFSLTNWRLRSVDGLVGTPGITFESDVDSGFYRIGSNNIALALAGAKVVDFLTTGITITGLITSTTLSVSGVATISGTLTAAAITASGVLSLVDGSAAAPSLKVGDEQNGVYSPAANQLGFAVAGALAATLSTSGFKWGTGENTLGLIVKRKTADESVTNSDVLQNDDHLTFSIAANEEWVGDLVLTFGSAIVSTGGSIALTFPAGATLRYATHWIANNSTVVESQTTTSGLGQGFTTASGTTATVRVKFWVLNGANAGSVTLQWAQGIIHASALTLFRGATLTAHRIV